MTERRTARRYDLSLPVIIRVPAERIVADSQKGKTRDISTRGLYFVLEQDLEAGSELDITLTLPAEITHGSEVFVRALGKVVRVERRMEDGSARLGVAAVIERYDIIRGENGRAEPPRGSTARPRRLKSSTTPPTPPGVALPSGNQAMVCRFAQTFSENGGFTAKYRVWP